jgi:K+-sensing histidine kinase KdpD
MAPRLLSPRVRRWMSGVLASVVVAVAFLPPHGSLSAADSRSLAALGVFLATAVVVAEAAARSRRPALVSARLGEEQSALRRVATLVARGVAPDVVLAAVAQEVGQLTGADASVIFRFDDDGMATLAAMHGLTDDDRSGIRVGIRWKPEPRTLAGTGWQRLARPLPRRSAAGPCAHTPPPQTTNPDFGADPPRTLDCCAPTRQRYV